MLYVDVCMADRKLDIEYIDSYRMAGPEVDTGT